MPTKNCLHCGSPIQAKRHRVFCSIFCDTEHRKDNFANKQRIDSFQALAESGSWLAIESATLYLLANPERRIKLLEHRFFSLENMEFSSYRLTPAGHQLLAHWKSSMEVSV